MEQTEPTFDNLFEDFLVDIPEVEEEGLDVFDVVDSTTSSPTFWD